MTDVFVQKVTFFGVSYTFDHLQLAELLTDLRATKRELVVLLDRRTARIAFNQP